MGNTPGQKRAQEARGKKKKKKQQRPADPRTSAIVPKAGPVTVRKADGTVEVHEALPSTKVAKIPYSKARPRKAF